MFSETGSHPGLVAGLRRGNNDGGQEDPAAAGNVSMSGNFGGITGLLAWVGP